MAAGYTFKATVPLGRWPTQIWKFELCMGSWKLAGLGVGTSEAECQWLAGHKTIVATTRKCQWIFFHLRHSPVVWVLTQRMHCKGWLEASCPAPQGTFAAGPSLSSEVVLVVDWVNGGAVVGHQLYPLTVASHWVVALGRATATSPHCTTNCADDSV